jgi:zinc transport system ATP-binding protein
MLQENDFLSAHHIHVVKNKQTILTDISLRVKNHDFITIIGPNGAGKSMLLKCLMGFYKPTSGIINKKNDLRIGYVPQKLYCDATLPISVLAFLRLGKHGISNAAFDAIINETDIAPFLNKQLHILSGGQLQRVLLARSLVHNPHLLILDEPAQNLDIAGQLAFYKLLENIYERRGLSILMVSHDLHMVMASSKQVICLYQHICCTGEPSVITKDPEFIALFGKDMATMMAIYQHNHNHSHDNHSYNNHNTDCGHHHNDTKKLL